MHVEVAPGLITCRLGIKCTDGTRALIHRHNSDGNKDITPKELFQVIHNTVEPRYNEVSRYRKNVRYSGVFVIAKTPL